MNSCITGFIQYNPTNNIINILKNTKAPPNNKVWSFEELSFVASWIMAWKFWFILSKNTKLNYWKNRIIEALTGKFTGSFYFFKIWKIFKSRTFNEGCLNLSVFLKIYPPIRVLISIKDWSTYAIHSNQHILQKCCKRWFAPKRYFKNGCWFNR